VRYFSPKKFSLTGDVIDKLEAKSFFHPRDIRTMLARNLTISLPLRHFSFFSFLSHLISLTCGSLRRAFTQFLYHYHSCSSSSGKNLFSSFSLAEISRIDTSRRECDKHKKRQQRAVHHPKAKAKKLRQSIFG
jgi:hypothetical protein